MGRPFPIVEYAHKINKNTSEFTVNDLVAFMKWWTKQPQRKDILAMRNEYIQKGAKTGRFTNTKAIVEVESDEKEVVESDVVAELGLTQIDVDALKWALGEIFSTYDLKGTAYEKPLTEFKVSLDSL